MKKILQLVCVGFLIISCSPKTTDVTELKTVETVVPTGDAAEGNTLYQAHCGKCHELPVVSRYSKQKWQKIVPSMCKEARLDATQESKISAYVNWKLQQQ
jgi:hypothetical protein